VPSLPQIPGYSVEREIGRGGMARVYLAVQRKFGRLVAIKLVSSEFSDRPDFGVRFVREARIVSQLHHPGIVQVYDAGVSGDCYYMVMEYLRGGDLNRCLERGLSMQAAVDVVKDIARALDFAHAKGYIHRDIKPENILFREDGSALLSDFGIAALFGDDTPHDGKVLGTPEYMSPEQAMGRPLDGRSDIYSLGVVFFRVLTGDVPYHADSAVEIGLKHMQEPIPRLPGYLSQFQGIVDRFLAKRPDNRFQSGAEIVTALEQLKVDGKLPNSVIKTQAVTTAEIRAVSDIHLLHDPRALRADARPDRLRQRTRISTRAWVALLLIGILGGGAWIYPDREQMLERALYATGLVESPEVKEAWRAAQSLRRDPNQGLAAVVAGYRRVLAISPMHERAQATIDALAVSWKADIESALEAEDLGLAEAKLNEALTVFPASETLGVLYERLGNLKRAESLVASTEALLRSRGLSDMPSATTAIQAYQEVLRLHPANARARADLDRLARHYGSLASTAADDGDIAFAMSYLHLAASANPNHPALTPVRDQIHRAATLQEEITMLLRQADEQLSRGFLVDPPSDNAAELYRRVLATDPENALAVTGLERVSEEAQRRGDRLLAAGRIVDLRALVERASEVGLNSSVVDRLQRRLSAEERRRAELERLLAEARELYDSGFITAPADSNAVDRLVRALRLDPDNREARQLLRASGERLVEVAKEAHEAGLGEEARRYLELALGVVPDQADWRRMLHDWTADRRGEQPGAAAASTRSASPDGAAEP
jgi:serine/threonine-protein kinase PpkA